MRIEEIHTFSAIDDDSGVARTFPTLAEAEAFRDGWLDAKANLEPPAPEPAAEPASICAEVFEDLEPISEPDQPSF